ncbi:unnamed protein product [Cochlearia groenlandica]
MVCQGPCRSWRYRCELCRFDIHMECILAVCNTSPNQTEPSGTTSRGLKPQVGQPSQHAPWQQTHFGYPYAYGPMNQQPYGYHNYNNYNYMNGLYINYPGQVPVGGSDQKPTRSKGWRMFTIATKLIVGVVSNVLFGVNLASLVSSC